MIAWLMAAKGTLFDTLYIKLDKLLISEDTQQQQQRQTMKSESKKRAIFWIWWRAVWSLDFGFYFEAYGQPCGGRSIEMPVRFVCILCHRPDQMASHALSTAFDGD